MDRDQSRDPGLMVFVLANGPIRVGIVGLGKIAEHQHVPVIQSHPDFVLVATVSDRDATVPGVAAYRTMGEMLQTLPELDAVAICTPPGPRHALAREALLADRHVLLEKPPAATLEEAEDLVALAREGGRSLFATWHSRFAAGVEPARRALVGEEVVRMSVVWKEDVRHWHPGQEWIWKAGGFGVFDPGINALSIVTLILPGPLVLRSAILEVPANKDMPIAARLAFTNSSKEAQLDADFDWRQTGPQTWAISVETRSGKRLALTAGGARLEIDGISVPAGPQGEYRRIYDAFAHRIRAGTSDVDLSPLRLVAEAFRIGRRIVVDDFKSERA